MGFGGPASRSEQYTQSDSSDNMTKEERVKTDRNTVKLSIVNSVYGSPGIAARAPIHGGDTTIDKYYADRVRAALRLLDEL